MQGQKCHSNNCQCCCASANVRTVWNTFKKELWMQRSRKLKHVYVYEVSMSQLKWVKIEGDGNVPWLVRLHYGIGLFKGIIHPKFTFSPVCKSGVSGNWLIVLCHPSGPEDTAASWVGGYGSCERTADQREEEVADDSRLCLQAPGRDGELLVWSSFRRHNHTSKKKLLEVCDIEEQCEVCCDLCWSCSRSTEL